MQIAAGAVLLLVLLSNEIRQVQSFYQLRYSSRLINRIVEPSQRWLQVCCSASSGESVSDLDDIFGSEFNQKNNDVEEAEIRQQAIKGFENVRSTFLVDGIFVGAIGLSITLGVGTFNDAVSYAVGAVLGLGYSLLLGKYVERLGANESGGDGNSRFLPAIVLIALYGKYKDIISIIPELLGFFSTYKIATLLQIFNRNLYGEESVSIEEIEAERNRLLQ